MRRVLTRLGLIGLAAVALAFGMATPAHAQFVVVGPGPVVVAPRPVVSYYSPPYATYAPRVAYYPSPIVTTTYAAPVMAAPFVTTYAAPVMTTAPGVYTTYTYRNGLGIFRPRYVNQTYYSPYR